MYNKKIRKPSNPYSPLWAMYWAQNPTEHRGVGADGVNDGDGEPGDGEAGGEGAGEAGGEGEGKPSEGEGKPSEGEGNKGPTDEEAKLLKEVMSKKQLMKEQQAKIDELSVELKRFDGVDLEQVQKLLEEQEAAKTKELEKKGEWDKLKAQMVEQQKQEKEQLQNQIDELKNQLSGKSSVISDLTVGHSFDSSTFVDGRTNLTASKARIIYGNHFEIEDGAIIGYDKPAGSADRTMLVNGDGEPLKFDAAIEKIVDADPDRDHILKAKAKPGSDSRPSKGKPADSKPTLHGQSKIAAALSSGS